MRNKLDRREKIERENTHNRLSIYNISALNEIYLVFNENDLVNKFSYIL